MILYLPKLTLWKSSDVTTYPRCLARGKKEVTYSREEILEFFGISPTLPENRRDALRDIHRNIWDVEPRDKDVILRGVCLVEHNDAGFQMTPRAEALVDAFQRDRNGLEWQKELVSILVDYDVRLRVVLYLIGTLDYALMIHPYYRLCSPYKESSDEYALFQNEEPNLNTLLSKWRDHLIGEALWQRIERIGLERSTVSGVSGMRGGQPSLEVRSFIQEVRLLLEVGVLKKVEKGGLSLVKSQAKHVLSSESFNELIRLEDTEAFLSVLRDTYQNLRDTEGYVIYDHLRKAVESEISEKRFETLLQCALEERKVVIVRHEKGLRFDGMGFLGDPEFQRLQLAFNE